LIDEDFQIVVVHVRIARYAGNLNICQFPLWRLW